MIFGVMAMDMRMSVIVHMTVGSIILAPRRALFPSFVKLPGP